MTQSGLREALIISKRKAVVTSEGNSMIVGSAPSHRAEAAVDRRLYELGHECRMHFDNTKCHSLSLGVCIAEAKELLCTGRTSQFPDWLAEHLPEMDRKTADRLARVTTAFGLNKDTLSKFQSLAESIRLTALYRLSGPSVPEQARQAAMTAAEAGETISVARADELISIHTVTTYSNTAPRASRSKTHRRKKAIAQVSHSRTIELPSGTIVININHGDFLQALVEAQRELGENDLTT